MKVTLVDWANHYEDVDISLYRYEPSTGGYFYFLALETGDGQENVGHFDTLEQAVEVMKTFILEA